ncbi:VWA domain-containing protein [Halorubellus sp. JP-L1]|uniref:vWA domain-containing protein n=1 Tax=Halorubellus sp. JP-L1 TaxID=2715753 RepID=UPI0014086C1B|nr:VWA domain-containing protein [Halorubellus sp. JP-L1]NHN43617.1 VWA domain-containing protein [Halorubellus sp. JP-L1]
MSPRSRRSVLALATAASASLAGCNARVGGLPTLTDDDDDGKVDDWQFSPGDLGGGDGGSGGSAGSNVTYQSASADGASTESVGLAAGGAKDANTFRRNVENDYLPIPSSVSYEGLFYDYYFDTGGSKDSGSSADSGDTGTCSDLFCPTYLSAVTADPLDGETERYLSVGLNSGLETDAFDRKRLNLVVVLDVSGSMSSSFDEYYYDQYGNEQEVEDAGSESKMQVAKDALAAVTEQLRPDDRLGVVLYNQDATVAKPLNPVSETDMDAIRGHIREDIQPGGGTSLSAGMDDATRLLDEYANADQTTYENRMLVLTDAMPNVGDTSEGGLRGRLESAAAEHAHATFVGVGVDFNTDVVDEITSVRGANYYSVHSPSQFRERVVENFEYVVTPLVFDLSLELDAEGYEIRQVYGSSAADEATGRMLHVNTLFASPTAGGETRGGVVLAKVARTDDAAAGGSTLTLRASWKDRTGTTNERETTVAFPDGGPEQFANAGVRKAVLLSRYADLLKNWMVDERERDGDPSADGIEVPDDHLGEWEQQSEDLTVSAAYRERFATFADHFEAEMAAVDDDALEQELDVLATLASADAADRHWASDRITARHLLGD